MRVWIRFRSSACLLRTWQWTFRLHTVAEFLMSPTITSLITVVLCMISGFHRKLDVNCALLGCYTASSGDSFSTFRDGLSVPPSGIVFLYSWPLKMGPLGCPETSARNYHYSLYNNAEESSSQEGFCSKDTQGNSSSSYTKSCCNLGPRTCQRRLFRMWRRIFR